MPLGGGHLSGSLERACNQTKMALEDIKEKGLGTQPQKRPYHTYLAESKKSSTSWAIFILRWEDQLTVLCANANKVFMRTVQKNVFLILNRVPVTFFIDPELIRPSIPVMTHSLDQKVTSQEQSPKVHQNVCDKSS